MTESFDKKEPDEPQDDTTQVLSELEAARAISELFQRGKVKLGARYKPKLKLQIACDRMPKKIIAFEVDVPVQGKDENILKEIMTKLKTVLRQYDVI